MDTSREQQDESAQEVKCIPNIHILIHPLAKSDSRVRIRTRMRLEGRQEICVRFRGQGRFESVAGAQRALALGFYLACSSLHAPSQCNPTLQSALRHIPSSHLFCSGTHLSLVRAASHRCLQRVALARDMLRPRPENTQLVLQGWVNGSWPNVCTSLLFRFNIARSHFRPQAM